MTEDGTPNWLAMEEGHERKASNEESPKDEQAAGKESVEIGSTLATTTIEKEGNNKYEDNNPKRKPLQRGRLCCITTISTILFALFVYATAVQDNDPDKLQWSFYYGLVAVIPALFTIHFCCRGKIKLMERTIYCLSSAMSVWSIVLIVVVALDLKSTSGGDDNLREELIFEIAGASIGLLTAMYHMVLMWRV